MTLNHISGSISDVVKLTVWTEQLTGALLTSLNGVGSVLLCLRIPPTASDYPADECQPEEPSVIASSRGAIVLLFRPTPLTDRECDNLPAELGLAPAQDERIMIFDLNVHDTPGNALLFLGYNGHSAECRSQINARISDLRTFLTLICNGIEAAVHCNILVGSSFSARYSMLCDNASLTPRERQVLSLVFQGNPQKSIADILGVTHNTIRKHVKEIHRKTGTHSLSEIIAKYFNPKDLRNAAGDGRIHDSP